MFDAGVQGECCRVPLGLLNAQKQWPDLCTLYSRCVSDSSTPGLCSERIAHMYTLCFGRPEMAEIWRSCFRSTWNQAPQRGNGISGNNSGDLNPGPSSIQVRSLSRATSNEYRAA